mgnify:CR=1 FL=1
MDYFKNYGLTDEDIEEIEEFLSDDDINNYYISELKVIEILDYLKSIGIKNIKDILKYKSNIFYESVNNIKKNIKKDPIIISLINEDIQNFDRIGY